MASERNWRLLVPAPIRHLPADLAGVLALVALASLAVLLPGVRETPLRIVLGLPFVLFLPGYAFVAALFPERAAAVENTGERRFDGDDSGIDGIERVALSFGLSIAVVPLLGLALNLTPWGIGLVPIVGAVGGFTVLCTIVAARRRWALPEDDRFRVPYREWYARAHDELLEPDTRTDAVLNLLLALSVVLAVTSVGYAIAFPQEGERFTEFYVVTEDDDGDLVAANYPTEFEAGDRKPVVLGIENQEHEPVEYTVVVQVQRVEFHDDPANDTTRVEVVEREELQRFNTELRHDETWHGTVELEPTMTGEDLRLAFLLYRGDPPDEPTADDAYRELHLWIDVSPTNESAGSVDGS